MPQFLSRSGSVGTGQSPLRGLLVIRVPAGSLTLSWKIDPSTPTLSVTSDQWANLFEGKFDLGRYLGVRLQGILFEVDKVKNLPDEAARCQKEFKRMQDYLPNLKSRLLVSRPIANPNSVPPELRPAVISPPSAAEATKQII